MREQHPRRWVRTALVAACAAVAVIVPGPGAAAADPQMRPLEEALGDALEVRRDPPDRDVEGGSGPPREDPTAEVAPEDGADQDDGVRGVVPPEDGASGSDGTGTPADADTDTGADVAEGPDLDRPGEDVEGEGRGAGELRSGLPGRSLLIAVAVLAIVGSAAAVVWTQRRWERVRS